MHALAEIPFKFELPIEVWEKAGEPGKERRIGGVISTESRDRQGEIVLQRGLDFSEFTRNGWFNDNHSKETTGIVGYPTKVEQRTIAGRAGHFVEGYLLPGYEPADKIWNLARSLQKTGRRLGFSIEGSVVRRTGPNQNVIAEAKVRNVAITNCFPGDVRVCGAADKVTRRFYSGPMVEIRLSTGEKLTGTPNHPVFTQRGWVPMGLLDEVHDRIGRYGRDIVSAAPVAHDVQDVPPSFEEIFDFACLSGARRWIGLAGESQFHGDVAAGDVDVVLAHGFLRDRLHTTFAQKFGKDALAAADKQAALLAGDGAAFEFGQFGLFAPSRSVGGQGQALALGGGTMPVAQQLVFVPGPGDSSALGDVKHGRAGNFISGGDCGRTLSRAIGFGNVVFKRVFDFAGHVFNLDTAQGWYEANGIVAHNCPVNTDTGLDVLTKSIQAMESLDDAWFRRAMMAGGGLPGQTESGFGVGAPLRVQSLERDPKVVTIPKRKRLTKAEAVEFLRSKYRGMTDAYAERIFRFASQGAT